MRDSEKAYAAGVFDGEGCINVTNKLNGTIKVEITNTKYSIISYFEQRWEKGKTNLSWDKNPKHKPIYRWRLHGKKAECFLRDILPYTTGRATIIRLALGYIEMRKSKERDEIVNKLNEEIHRNIPFQSINLYEITR